MVLRQLILIIKRHFISKRWQTPTYKDIKGKELTLLDWYADIFVKRAENLNSISKILSADAYFSKRPFVDKILDQTDFNVISRLRNDADLLYLYKGKPTGKKGRPKTYDGKVILKNINKDYFELIQDNKKSTIYSAVVYSKGLKPNIKLVYEELNNNNNNKFWLLFFSTDTKFDALMILKYYKNRFQIEFLYRDGKQHTGLTHCQARSENKLHFHFNASLTAINLAMVEYWLSVPKEQRGAFSMADVKTMFHNTLMLQRFIDVFAVPAYKLKNIHNVKELINFGKIAA